MRRALSSFVFLAAAICATLALGLFTAVHTVADPSRPGRVADAVLSSSAGQRVMTDAITGVLAEVAPQVPAPTATKIAHAAATDPGLAAAVRTAASGDGKVQLGPVLHDAAAAVDPAVAKLVPARKLSVNLPGRGLTWLSSLRARMDHAYRALALLAAGLFAGALLVAKRRSRVLRRGGTWCLFACTGGLLAFYVTPRVLADGHGDAAAAAAVALRVAGAGVVGPLLLLLGTGVVLLVTGTAAKLLSPISARSGG